MVHILVVEDDLHTRRLLETVLKQEGFLVSTAMDGVQALETMERQKIDLIVLDVMMPNMDGFELTRQLRASGDMRPILMVSAKQLPQDRKQGFIVGTDDYMTKPVDEEEMLLRIRALLRRAKIVSDHKLIVGRVTLDYDALTVSRVDDAGRSETQMLPQKEFYLLYKLLSYPNQIFTRLQLMDEIWGMETESADTTVNVHINRLRKRFEHVTEFEIITVRGLGYKVVKHV